MKKQVALIVLDGWGHREEVLNNATKEAHIPFFESLWKEYPHALLQASGPFVGLPDGQMGNSEVGHTTIGAGKVVDTDLVRIGKDARGGTFVNNETFKKLFATAIEKNSTLHVIGLVGPGGIHSHSEHLIAFLKAAASAGVKKIAVHLFTDGRDTPPHSGANFIKEIEDVLAQIKVGKIATISGRYFAMDRDNNWDRTQKAIDAIFEGKGRVAQGSASEYLRAEYETLSSDEYVEPFIETVGEEYQLRPHDVAFFFNFRADRARQLSRKILEFAAGNDVLFATMTSYGDEYACPVAYPPQKIFKTLAGEIAAAGLSQVHIAETEKFPHATYFLNGGRELPHNGEIHELLPSRKDVPTHDLAPEMRAEAIADKAIEQLENGIDFMFINFANPDMVGHTANVPAIIKALETVDRELKRVIDILTARGGTAFITADHGNAEINIDVSGAPHTAHTTNPVPFIVTDTAVRVRDGGLADIAPTILTYMNIAVPEEMTGKDLLA